MANNREIDTLSPLAKLPKISASTFRFPSSITSAILIFTIRIDSLQASTLFTNCLVFSIAPSENLKPEPDTGLAEATGHLTGHHYPSSDYTGGSGNYFKLSSVHSPLSASFGAASGIAINHDYTPTLRTVTN